MAFSFFLLFELISAFASESYFEVEIVEKLQSVVEKQRGQIKKLEQSNIEFKSDNEEVSNMYNEFHQIVSPILWLQIYDFWSREISRDP